MDASLEGLSLEQLIERNRANILPGLTRAVQV